MFDIKPLFPFVLQKFNNKSLNTFPKVQNMTIGSLYVICLCSLTDRSFKVLSITIK